nr:PREDICTED: uncharacterized protein LOC105679628 [Linepithema humile]
MYSMDNLERDMMNRQYIYEAHSFLGNPAIPALPPHCGVPTTATLPAVIPSQLPSSHHPSGSTGSTSGSEHYLYDENSSDNESVYSSDQENHARERSRSNRRSGGSGKCPRQVQKVIVRGSGGNPFISHSLSWSRKSDISPNGTMYAKVWTPEDPRTSKSGTTFE